jgi:diacylglycerol kinase
MIISQIFSIIIYLYFKRLNLMNDYLKKRIASFRWAIQGLFDLFRQHPNAQIHLFATMLVLGLSFWLKLSSIEWCIIIFCISHVMALEALNSALEYLADKITKKEDLLIGKAKDIAAGAVLMGAIGAMIVGGIIFLPKLALLWYAI